MYDYLHLFRECDNIQPMQATRRGFFQALFAAPLVRPLARFLPDPLARRWKILTPSLYSKIVLHGLQRSLIVAQSMHADSFTMAYPKIGDTIKIRKPCRFIA